VIIILFVIVKKT